MLLCLGCCPTADRTHGQRPQPPHPIECAEPATVGSGSDQALVPAAPVASEAARYIAEFTAELSAIAKHSGLDLLAYLLDMAHLEATRAEDDPRTL
jgi:hypothetical protein